MNVEVLKIQVKLLTSTFPGPDLAPKGCWAHSIMRRARAGLVGYSIFKKTATNS